MKRIVTLMVMIMIIQLFSISALAYSGAEPKQGIVKDDFSVEIDELAKQIDAIKCDFPEASLDLNQAIDFSIKLAKMPAKEQSEYIAALLEKGPLETFTHRENDGSYITLNVYAPMLAETTAFTPGTQRVSGNTIYYTGSKVAVRNFQGFSLANASYKVDHFRNAAGSGSVQNAYSFTGNGNSLVTIGGYYYIQTSGSKAVVDFEMYQTSSDTYGAPDYYGTFRITFTANTFGIATSLTV